MKTPIVCHLVGGSRDGTKLELCLPQPPSTIPNLPQGGYMGYYRLASITSGGDGTPNARYEFAGYTKARRRGTRRS